MSKQVVNEFRFRYKFLSNSYPCTVRICGFNYPSAEHAYQASKTLHTKWIKQIRNARSAKKAIEFGRQAPLVPWFERSKVEIMTAIVVAKFKQNDDLRERLVATGKARLINGGDDLFWGKNGDKGLNYLGRILMNLRTQINIGKV